MTGPTRALMIGEFARRCRLPISTLRYYDKIGLLRPAHVEASNGYRRYTGEQIASAVLISRLRAIGTAPSDIATVLAGGGPAMAVLAAERRRAEAQVRDGERALAEINQLIAHHDDTSNHDVQLVSFPRTRVATAPFASPSADIASAVLRSIARLRGVLRRARLERTGPWGAGLPLQITEQVNGFVFAHVCPPVENRDLRTIWLSATRAVRTLHHNNPDTVALAYGAMLDVIDERGWTPAGPVLEEYLALETASTGGDQAIRLTVPIA